MSATPSPTRPQSQPMPAPQRVRIDIGRLSLHGYTHEQQQHFMRALEAELADLMPGMRDTRPFQSRRLTHLEALHVSAGAPPEQAARMLARRLVALLGRSARETTHE